MTLPQLSNKKFSECCFALSEEDILQLDKVDNGPINNVISGINKHCFGAMLYDDEYGLVVEMFYINNVKTLKGLIIRLDLNDKSYFELLFRFCVLLTNTYEVDTIDAFNTFQTKLRGFLEKSGFFTTTSHELKQFEDKNAVMMVSSRRGIFKLNFIDKVDFLQNFFSNYDAKTGTESIYEYVYLMVNTDTSLMKIGTSKNPIYREKTLHSQEPKVHLVAKWNCSKEREKILHQKYKHKRIRGEWFRLDLNDLKEIEIFMNSETSNSC
jgi:hypothetical protein